MISAKEAKELYEKSGARVKVFLIDKEVEPKVKEAIDLGKNSCTIYLGAEPVFKIIAPSVFHQHVMEQLRILGYKVQFGRYGETYVPRGLGDGVCRDEYCNYGIMISW